ncbi:uncharacterized protein SETTUDRAFT_24071 [Exserohilum turcica Et28A]|uniref:Uncharacterized protein n=1 Tax=Exserohilum turcicum (strain 28A) TaxID=671987 RepID=R0JZS7_EXST2|nr:uncharacterized protein SETTUDRAFT_24071 [Exserohilum turcica Et28A]EOA81682.1 hypothetical protein SETTUDRAFT_24071 [Exserohilum turcica Et28A]
MGVMVVFEDEGAFDYKCFDIGYIGVGISVGIGVDGGVGSGNLPRTLIPTSTVSGRQTKMQPRDLMYI